MKNQWSDDKERNDLTTKNWGTIWQRRTTTKNKGRTDLSGRLDDLGLICTKNSEDREEDEVKLEWGCQWEETGVFFRRWDVLVSVDGFADGFSDVCTCLHRWVCMFGCESVLKSLPMGLPMVMSALVSGWDLYVWVRECSGLDVEVVKYYHKSSFRNSILTWLHVEKSQC